MLLKWLSHLSGIIELIKEIIQHELSLTSLFKAGFWLAGSKPLAIPNHVTCIWYCREPIRNHVRTSYCLHGVGSVLRSPDPTYHSLCKCKHLYWLIYSSCYSSWWLRQMETFSALCERNPPVTGGFLPQRPMFSLICTETNGWANNWDAGVFRRHRAHCDVTVMLCASLFPKVSCQKGPTRHAYAWPIGPFWQDTLSLGLINAKQIIRVYKNPRDKNYIHESRLTVLGYPVNVGRSYTALKGRPISVPPMSAPIVDTRISAILLFSGVFLRLSLSINNNLITT